MTYEFKKLNMFGAYVLHCPNFFDDPELWYDLIDNSVNWQSFDVMVYGKKFKQPRDSFYMADHKHPYKYAGYDRKPEEWSVPITEMKKILNELIKKIQPDHPQLNACLGNRYQDGKQSIGYHSDDEGDLNPNAFIVSVSFGASRDFIFSNIKTGQKVNILLESGSILLMGGECQKNWKHSVPKRLKVTKPRINLTFRSVIQRNE